ncbi:hypothetical protein GuL6_009 [Buttiauxella phage vB_ButM_GuL6]|nr:hypothetical protein GuL6_009 [Buttiauxella phage vB_ButM_GuL6]
MLVYRIELCVSTIKEINRNKLTLWNRNVGPYVTQVFNNTTLKWLENFYINPRPCISLDDARHPAPWEDDRLTRNLECRGGFDGLHFGFSSLPKLSKWFNKYERERLHNCGFVCMVYEVDKLYAGKAQCVFDLQRANLVNMLSLKEIY